MISKACSTIFLDVRNFTSNLSQHYENDIFIELIQSVYQYGLDITSKFVEEKDFYLNSTGDGFVLIVFDEFHYLSAFCISLILQKEITSFIKETNLLGPNREGDYYFGIGLESGEAKELSANIGNKRVNTYLGNVINIAARLEALTKDYSRAPIIYGPELNELLVKHLFNKSYKQLMGKAKLDDSEDIIDSLHREMNEINSKLLSSYLFEHRLKGVQEPQPAFRISPTLSDFTKQSFSDFVNILPEFYKTKIREILK